MPEQMPGERGDSIIAAAFRHPLADQPTPIREWMAARNAGGGNFP